METHVVRLLRRPNMQAPSASRNDARLDGFFVGGMILIRTSLRGTKQSSCAEQGGNAWRECAQARS